jgi:BASS family bile acid:Na+ symporter
MTLLAALFTAAMMFAASLVTSDEEIRRVLRERRVLARALLVNIAVVPAIAFALRVAFHATGAFGMGALLAAVSPGAPFGTFIAGRFRQDVALAMVLTCGLTIIALITTPLSSLLIFGPERMVLFPPGFGLLVVAAVLLLPVWLGRAIRLRAAAVAARLARAVNILSFVLLLGANFAAAAIRAEGVRAIHWRGSALILALVAASIAAGWMCGTTAKMRATLGTSTGLRNVGLAFLYAEFKFPGTGVIAGVAAYSVLMLVPSFLFAALMRWRRARADQRQRAD